MTEREGKGNKEKFNENDFFKVYLGVKLFFKGKRKRVSLGRQREIGQG